MKYKYILLSSICLYDFSAVQTAMAQNNRTPNIIYIMSDDHASQAVSAYGGILSNLLPTPNIDRIAHEGAILRNCFVTNSISTPSRGAIITGQYSQKNGVYTLQDPLDPDHPNVAKCLQHPPPEGHLHLVGAEELNEAPVRIQVDQALIGY